MEEVWKDIKGYEGLYQVSTCGRVKSLKRVLIKRDNRKCTVPEKIMKCSFDGMYYQVMLWKMGKFHKVRIHRLVAETFLPNPNNFNYVNHKDLNKFNNNIENLEWCTQLHNMRDARDKGIFDYLMRSIKVIETGEIYKSINECAMALGLNDKNISACLNGKRKRCGGYHFERV